MVVPKRHARRSVTRNLIKRQMREVMRAVVDEAVTRPQAAAALERAAGTPQVPVLPNSAGLPKGLWVLRLKSPFDPKLFRSPASVPLRQAAREEIALLLARAIAPRAAGGAGDASRRGRSSASPSPAPVAPAARD